MDIDEYGFLGKDIEQYEIRLIKKYKEVFDFIEELNNFFNIMKFKIDVKNNDIQGETIVALFTKSLTTFQAIYFLFKHYLCNNAENLSRILFEEMVNIAYCSLGENETRRYFSLELIEGLKSINKIIENKNIFSEEEIKKYTKEKSYLEKKQDIIDELKNLQKLGVKGIFNKKGKPCKISLEERIKQIKSIVISNYYLSFYSIVSSGIHSYPKIVTKYIEFDEFGLGKRIRTGPLAENCEIIPIIATIHFMIINIEYLNKYFKYPEKDIITKYKNRLKKIGDKYHYFT